MSAKINLGALDKVGAFLHALSGTYTVTIQGLSGGAREKVSTLARTGRPLTTGSPAMRQTVVRFAQAALQSGKDLTHGVIVRTVEAAFKTVFVLRAKNEGNDLPWRKSPPGYRASKAARGLDTRTGVATGALLRELEASRVELVKH